MSEDTKTANAVYEVGYHIVPTVSPESLAEAVDEVKSILAKVGAVIISEESPKMRTLSYPMLKVAGPKRQYFDTAYFGWIKFEASAETMKEIKKALDVSEKILRFILIKTVHEQTLYGYKFAKETRETTRKSMIVDRKPEIKEPVNEAELDKSIDKLVIE